jgi:hypothetical protein
MSFLMPNPGIVPFVPASVSFAASTGSSTNLTVYTFSGHAIGTEAANRKVVVVTGSVGGTALVTSLTVAGNSASLVKEQRDTVANERVTSMWQVDVSSGTTGDIVVTWAGAKTACAVGVWAVYGAAASTSDTGAADEGTPAALTITIPANGVCIGGSICNTPAAWALLTERHDDPDIDANFDQSGASDAFATLQTERLITVTADSEHNCSVIAAWATA